MFSRVIMSGRLQGLFALLPVAGAQLVGLQRIEHAEHLLGAAADVERSEEHTSELQSLRHLVCRLLLEKKNFRRPSAVPGRSTLRTRVRGPACRSYTRPASS